MWLSPASPILLTPISAANLPDPCGICVIHVNSLRHLLDILQLPQNCVGARGFDVSF